MKVCAVIPVYNHGEAVGAVVKAVRGHGLPCVLVDDGSEPGCAAVMDGLAREDSAGVEVVRLPQNEGKGGAMMAGLRAALSRGYSHALQIDADGQHNANDIPRFLELAKAQPDMMVCGTPVYDESVPKGRLYGRYATHIWVWINTLSFAIRDSMCGFRVYPLRPTVALIDSVKIGKRMDFDVEVLVRLFWRGMRILNQPTQVRYPTDGISHFDVLWDNVRISGMHARLFFGMLVRLPVLLWNKVAK